MTMNLETNSDESPVGILVVEDSATQADQLEHLLAGDGYRTRSARDGREALWLMNEFKPQLVLSDVVMPEMGGYELCRRIKSHPDWREVPVVLLTALSDPEDIVRGLECGANNFVLKPFEPRTLLSRLRYVLLNHRLRANAAPEMGIEVLFSGRRHFITSERLQIVDCLFSTFETALERERELKSLNQELRLAHEQLDSLKHWISICARCGTVCTDGPHRQEIEAWVKEKGAERVCRNCSHTDDSNGSKQGL